MRFAQTLIALILLSSFFLSTRLPASNFFCEDLFGVEYRPVLSITGYVYNPTLPDARGVPFTLANGVLKTHNTSNSGQKDRHNIWRIEPVEPLHDIGFVPKPNDYYRHVLSQEFATGLMTFVDGFSPRSTTEEQQRIIAADQEHFFKFLDSQRLGFAYVERKDRKATELYSGYIRVIDATDYSRLGFKKPNSLPYYSPTEISQKKNGVKTNVFEHYRQQGYQIFQIGKYVVGKKQSAKERKIADKELLKWLLSNYLDPARLVSEKVIFVMNVDSEIHKKLYHLKFGAEPIDPNLFAPPIEPPNAILVVELATLRHNIEMFLKNN